MLASGRVGFRGVQKVSKLIVAIAGLEAIELLIGKAVFEVVRVNGDFEFLLLLVCDRYLWGLARGLCSLALRKPPARPR